MSARYLLGDWGTTHLRLYLMEQDQVVDVREGVGIGSLTSSPEVTLTQLVEQWLGAGCEIDVVLCGMASSRNGVCELPYVKSPATLEDWAQGGRRIQLNSLNVLLATGMQCGDDEQGFDVMRGEEAQIFGALALEPALRNGAQYFVLPGTHSKWVDVVLGSVQQFRTAFTGEMYALLRDHSTLLKAGVKTGSATEFDQGFSAGSERSLRVNEGLLTSIFKTRTAQLLQGRSPDWASGFLSGLLIGYELATMSSHFTEPRNVTLIGQTQLGALYQRAFAARGVTTRMMDGAACALAGMQQLRTRYASTGWGMT